MSLSIEIKKVDQVVVMELAGRLSMFEPQLRQRAWELIEQGERYFVINIADVSYLDNSGLGQLCWLYTVVRNRGGDLKLLRPRPRIQKLLNMTKLDTVFESFERETDATASIQGFRSAVSA